MTKDGSPRRGVSFYKEIDFHMWNNVEIRTYQRSSLSVRESVALVTARVLDVMRDIRDGVSDVLYRLGPRIP
jgi:hypothetical protein